MPASDAGDVNCCWNEPGARAETHRRGKGGGGGEPSEERAPQTSVTGMLIDEHSNTVAIANKLTGLDDTFLPLKQSGSQARPIAPDLGVDVAVAKGLENRAGFAGEKDGRDLSEQLPVPDVADHEDNAGANEPVVDHCLGSLYSDVGHDLFLGQAGNSDPGKEIGPQRSKVPVSQ